MIEQLNDNNQDRRRLHENKRVMDGKKKRPGLGEEIPDMGNIESRHRSKNAKMLVRKTTQVYRNWITEHDREDYAGVRSLKGFWKGNPF